MTDEAKPAGAAGAANPLLKFLIELGPLIIFFAVYGIGGIYWATGVLMVTAVLAIPASWKLLGHISPIPVATAVLVVIFGGLTLWLDDPSFIKMKPTIINLLFAGTLLVGLWTRRPLLKMMFGEAFSLSEAGWQKLTVRWIAFFLVLAVVNELVWRNFSESAWVNFKVFGILPLTMLFAMAQIGLIKRYELKTDA
jgi:intracellular septation protein